jgi:hypothetical protein
MFNVQCSITKGDFLDLVTQNKINLTLLVDQAPKIEFKRLTRGVIDFDKDYKRM